MTFESSGTDGRFIRRANISHFRGFKDLILEPLARINLIAGLNNVGKTAVLEALQLKNMPFNNFMLVLNAPVRNSPNWGFQPFMRGVEAPWAAWFHRYEVSQPIEIAITTNNSETSTLRLRNLIDAQEIQEKVAPVLFPGQPIVDSEVWAFGAQPHVLELQVPGKQTSSGFMIPQTTGYIIFEQSGQLRVSGALPQATMPAIYRPSRADGNPNELAQLFGQLVVQKQVPELVESLKMMEPRLKDITTVATPIGAQLYGDIGIGHQMPLKLMGEGTEKLTSLLVDAASARDGLLLIDEIENGFHYSVLESIWASLDQATRQSRVQLVATTHSLECIAAAQRYFSRDPGLLPSGEDFRVFRVERDGEAVKAIGFTAEELGEALELGFEVR